WLSALLLCLSPGLITLASVPLSEIIFTFFLAAAVYLFVSDKFLLSGLALSAATFCRPAGIFLFLPLAAWMLWQKKKTVLILLFIIGANLLPTFWTARNYLKYGYPVYTTQSNFYLLHYKAGSYLSWKNNVSFDDTRKELNTRLEGDNIFERSASAGKLGRRILLNNFTGFCLWAPRDLIRFWMPDINPLYERLNVTTGNRGTLDILRRQGIFSTLRHYFSGAGPVIIITFGLYCIFYCLLLAFMAAGLFRLWREKHYQILVFGSLLTAYFWLLPVGNLDWRFRTPVMPYLFLLAIYGLNAITALWQKLRNKSLSEK
ncbi:MAG: hypothetical protein PHV59_09820, partial [Victivallales bacterium]|nr:hypothetical protein [Victivallales bacterium]